MIKTLIKKSKEMAKNRRGSAAVEFAMLIGPFIFMIFALLEIMIIFLMQTTLEAATASEARKIRTGQAQNISAPITQTQFKTNVCAKLHGLADCTNRLFVMVESFATPPAGLGSPWADNDLVIGSAADEPWQTSIAGDMVVVRTYYVWPLFAPGVTNALSNFSNGTFGSNNRILVATSAFRNEPFE
ncbi:MAG: pilus assembly protein [Caulobacterales bacterium]|nr:pilus assembly protein [Caulobacterales bacterium]